MLFYLGCDTLDAATPLIACLNWNIAVFNSIRHESNESSESGRADASQSPQSQKSDGIVHALQTTSIFLNASLQR